MKYVVGVADMRASDQADDIIVTHALGSCLGVAVYDPLKNIGGILHAMLPVSSINPGKALANPFMFIDTALPVFFQRLYSLGGVKERFIIKAAGGASMHGPKVDKFAIGKRNYLMLKKLLARDNVSITASDVGGSQARAMSLEVRTGLVSLSTAGEEWFL